MIDFFGFRGGISPMENPEIYSFVTREGVLVPQKNGLSAIGCGDGLIVLAAEERYRRRVSFDDYEAIPPKIPGVKFREDYATPSGSIKLLNLLHPEKIQRP